MTNQTDRKGLSLSERWFALRSIILLHLISISIRWFGFTAVYRWMDHRLKISAAGGPAIIRSYSASMVSDQAARLGELVGIGNRRFKPLMVSCLPESLTVWWFLRRKGIDAHLRLGVRKVDSVVPNRSNLDGHAWVEVDNRVVSGDPDLAGQFTPMNSN